MVAINLAGQAGDIHEDVMATIEVALLETDSYRQCFKPTGFEYRDLRPTGAAAAHFMDNWGLKPVGRTHWRLEHLQE